MNPSEDLILRSQQGDLVALDELLRQSESHIFRLAVTILGDQTEAEDAMQEIFVRIFSKIKSYRHEAAFNTWLTAVVVNFCRNQLRRRKFRQAISLDWLLKRADPNQSEMVEVIHERIQRQKLWSMVDRLDDKYRLPVLLVYGEGLSVTEVARVLNKSNSTVYSRLSTALELLRGMEQRAGLRETRKVRENNANS